MIEDADDGTVWGVLLGRTVLKKRFETLEPRPGDTLGLKYVGWVEPRHTRTHRDTTTMCCALSAASSSGSRGACRCHRRRR